MQCAGGNSTQIKIEIDKMEHSAQSVEKKQLASLLYIHRIPGLRNHMRNSASCGSLSVAKTHTVYFPIMGWIRDSIIYLFFSKQPAGQKVSRALDQ